MRHTRDMLAHLAVPGHESQEVVAFLENLKSDVIQLDRVMA
jgi:hypothetical protein